MFACTCALCVHAANETYSVWDGSTLETVDLSSAVVDISSADQLAWIAVQNNDFANITFRLTRNIDLDGNRWTPIGSAAKPFKGTFLGNGHLVRGLRSFDGTDGLGLFGHVAQDGRIAQLGISGGTLVAKPKRRIGALVGVCDGAVSECWSMAEIAAGGNVVGGLVGELKSHGSLTDCYHSGLILNGSDTIGGIVGYNNGGSLTRVYNTGYAKNGKALAGIDKGGTYTDCYYDRKLYYQQSGVVGTGITPMDETEKMFDIFDGLAAWVTNVDDKFYPILSAFASTDAAQLSAAPMFINKDAASPVNHANDLTVGFTLNINGGITWACQDKDDEQWIQIKLSQYVLVVRPCSETDVLVDNRLNNETRVVYMRPRRWDDFRPGVFKDEEKEFCFEEAMLIPDAVQQTQAAQDGWGDGRYYYLLELSEITEQGDTVPIDTLYNGERDKMPYEMWSMLNFVPTGKAGWFVLRRYAHDSVCVRDWIRSEGEFVYHVFEEFNPGQILSGLDTVYLNVIPTTVTVKSEYMATGGGGRHSYEWSVNGEMLPNSDVVKLTHDISEPGTYTFTRYAYDEALCCAGNTLSEGEHTFVVFDSFDPGAVNEDPDKVFCSADEAKDYIITATEATGGSGKYHYQWYLREGNTDTPVSGAIDQDLPLASIRLEAGKTYTFIRKAEDDTRFTTWEDSRQKQTVRIMAILNPGSIAGGETEKICLPYDANPAGTITVSVRETRAASGDTDLEYRWIRQPDGATVGNEANLQYPFPIADIEIGTTYTYIREVRNPSCEWQQSSGSASQFYGQSTYTEQTITVCDEEMPYTMVWTSADGKRQTHTFNKSTDTWLVTDNSFDCPADTLFRIDVVSIPGLQIASTASFCQSTGVMTVYFEASGESNIFHITYSPDLAKYMGAPDTIGPITVPGAIVLEHVPSIGTGDIYMLVQIGYASSGEEGRCFSRSQRMDLDISLGGYVYSKYDRVLFVDNNPENGIDVGTTEKLEFTAYQWYRNGVEQEGQTGQYYHEDGQQLNGVYYVILTDTKGRRYRSCDVVMPTEGSAAKPQNSALYPVPANAGQALTVEGTGSLRIISLSGECVARMELIDGTTTVTAPRIGGMYYVQITNTAGETETHKLIVK